MRHDRGGAQDSPDHPFNARFQRTVLYLGASHNELMVCRGAPCWIQMFREYGHSKLVAEKGSSTLDADIV